MAKVEAISLQRRGLKLDGQWYNYPAKLDAFVKNLSKGDEVEIQLSSDGKTIIYINPVKAGLTRIKSSSSPAQNRTQSQSLTQTTQSQKLKFMALSLAVETAKAFTSMPESEDDIQNLVDTILQIADVYKNYLSNE